MELKEFEVICKEFGLNRVEGIYGTWDRPGVKYYCAVYQMNGVKGWVVTYLYLTKEIYVGKEIILSNYELSINGQKDVRNEKELKEGIENLLKDYKKKNERKKLNLLRKDFLNGECSVKERKGRKCFWLKILEVLQNKELKTKKEIIEIIGYCGSQVDSWKKLKNEGLIERVGKKYKITENGLRKLG